MMIDFSTASRIAAPVITGYRPELALGIGERRFVVSARKSNFVRAAYASQ
jgi:hypothetical protein